jgi:Bacterial Ig-like domain
MIKTINRLKLYIVCLGIFFLSACGGGGGGDSSGTSKTVDSGDTSPTVTSLSGIVADGYLRDARVFLDRNKNHLYDNGEPSTTSGAGGQYSLEVNPGEGDLYPVVVEVIAGQTVDEDNGLTVAQSYLLEAPAGHWQFVSPLTTLVKLERDKNPLFTEQQAVLSIITKLGIADNVSVFSNYLDSAGVSSAVAAEYVRTHKAARVVAHFLGQLRHSITLNLGGQVADGEQPLVAYLISDQIMEQADSIKQALDDERNIGSNMDVASIISIVSSDINSDNLNAELLSVYQQRLEQDLEVWDMQSPQLMNQLPAPNASTPINVVISTEFDELLDETLLSTNLIDLSGPNGLVTGQLEYDAAQKTLSFVPNELLLPLSRYQVTVNAQLADSLGNPLGQEISWAFQTVFSETPPPLPEIF